MSKHKNLDNKPSVLINGWFGPGNAGDEAILHSELSIFNEADMNTVVASPFPKKVEQAHGVNSIPEYSKDKETWNKIAKQVDHIVIGGGGLIESHNIARKWTSVVRQAAKLNTPVHFLGVGLTPPITSLHEILYKYCLKYSSTVIVRDYMSYEYISNLNISTPTYVMPDLAFRHSNTHSLSKYGNYKSKSLVIVLRDVPWLDIDIEGISDTISQLANRIDCKLTFLTTTNNDSDTNITEKVVKQLEIDVDIIRNASFKKMENVISNSRYVIGMRLHSIVFAAKHGVPFLSIAYNLKCENVPKQFGYGNVNWCMKLNSDIVADKIIQEWEDIELYNELDSLAADQHNKLSDIIDLLNPNPSIIPNLESAQLKWLPKIIFFERAIRFVLNETRPPVPLNAIPEGSCELNSFGPS